jgi:arginyl-tRNA synthetase
VPDPLLELRRAVDEAAAGLIDGEAGDATPKLERPPKPELGDYSTNAAMLLAPVRGEAPREVAERLRDELDGRLGSTADRIEVAGPGFLNLFLADRWYRAGVAAVLEAGDGFGAGVVAEAERVLVEFVSANPTGPLTAAGGRHAAYGDSVARTLGLAGHEVEREYYLNDMGGQVRRFAESIAARMTGGDLPEDGYAGAYVEELARELASAGIDPGGLDELERLGVERMRVAIEATLERFGVRFDTWYSERSLYESGKMTAAIDELRRRGHVYESEGAVWLRTTAFGDDKDRVLVRSDGTPTYMAPDIAYHRGKLERGYERLLDVLGADHHGYVGRMKAALEALGYEPQRLEGLIMQFVHVLEGEERAQMSKRRGEFVTLEELIDDIGTDAARFLMLQRSHDTTVDLDLELARRQSQDNPVYYVQYAHARIASILRKAGEGAADAALESIDQTFDAPVEPSERALVKRLLDLPGEVRSAAELRAPHRLCAFATATAADFHAFYRDCKVIGAESEGGSPPGTEAGRLAICVATKRVIAGTLDLLGVSAPERM